MTIRRSARTRCEVLAVSVLLTLSGCATQFLGSAASPIQGRAYVVGQEGNFAAVWLCPTDRAHGECQIVQIEEM